MSLQPFLVALVLLAAITHATWNALAKGSGDRLITIALIQGVPVIAGGLALPFLPFPAPPSWPFLAASVIIHNGYFFFLMKSYQDGDLSHVYPLARGSAPLMVALITASFAIEVPTAWGIAGIVMVSVGIASLAFGAKNSYPSGTKPVFLALATGVFITAYTICDGLGTRSAGTPFAYIVWLFFLGGIPFCVVTALVRRQSLASDLRQAWKWGIPAGALSAFAYALVLFAMSQGALAYVSALRETSVLFAAIIGTKVMKEPLGARRIAAAVIIVGGIMTMQIAG